VTGDLNKRGGGTMSERIIENEHLKVTVADSGAELVGVYDKDRAMERIWSGDPSVWNRHAPILFPFVGKVMGGEYRIGDRVYAMPTQHGFARDMAFECVSVDAVSTTHRLEATEWTRERYPYDFRLTVAHRLESRRLTVAWRSWMCACSRKTVERPVSGYAISHDGNIKLIVNENGADIPRTSAPFIYRSCTVSVIWRSSPAEQHR
jgi:hypothetical protein